jgi:hypothetical protein
VEQYRYYSASAGDLRQLRMDALTLRLQHFTKIHNQEMKNRIILAGGKP